jgi:hypothetical protein
MNPDRESELFAIYCAARDAMNKAWNEYTAEVQKNLPEKNVATSIVVTGGSPSMVDIFDNSIRCPKCKKIYVSIPRLGIHHICS